MGDRVEWLEMSGNFEGLLVEAGKEWLAVVEKEQEGWRRIGLEDNGIV